MGSNLYRVMIQLCSSQSNGSYTYSIHIIDSSCNVGHQDVLYTIGSYLVTYLLGKVYMNVVHSDEDIGRDILPVIWLHDLDEMQHYQRRMT